MDKKTFIIYKSWEGAIDKMTDEQVGQLFRKIYHPEMDITDPVVDILWGIVSQRLDEDSEKYAAKVERINKVNESKRNRDDIVTKSKRNRDDIVSDTDTVTDTVTVTETDTVSPTEIKEKDSPTESRKRKPLKKKYGAFGHVLLSDRDIELLYQNHGEMETQTAIDYLDAYIEEKGYKSKNHKMTLERWVFDAVKKKGHGDNRASNITPFNPTEYLLNQIREEEERRGQVGNGEDSNSNNSGVSGLFS